MEVDELAAAIRRVDDRVALELQWDFDDDDAMGSAWVLALHVIVARAGANHSRYSTTELARFAADQLDERHVAHRIAGATAAATGLSLHAPDVAARGGQGDSAWIRAQPAGPPHAYELPWHLHWWRDDGEPVHASGTDRVVARSGGDAELQLSRALEARFPVRPLVYRLAEGVGHGVGGAAANPRLPDRDRVRAIALTEGCRASGIARGLVARVPDVTALELMLAFDDSFRVSLERLAPLAAWRRGALDDVALDAALPYIANWRDTWDRPRRLRDARAAGRSIAAMMRDERERAPGLVQLTSDLREAFDMRLSDAKDFVDRCQDPRDDAELDASIPAR